GHPQNDIAAHGARGALIARQNVAGRAAKDAYADALGLERDTVVLGALGGGAAHDIDPANGPAAPQHMGERRIAAEAHEHLARQPRRAHARLHDSRRSHGVRPRTSASSAFATRSTSPSVMATKSGSERTRS